MSIFRLSRFAAGLALVCFVTVVSRSFADASSDQKRAIDALEQAVKTDPDNAELWLHLGFAYRKINQLDSAVNAFAKASTLNPHEEDAFYMLGLIYEKKGQKTEALQAWKNYLTAETDPVKRSVADKHIHQLEQ